MNNLEAENIIKTLGVDYYLDVHVFKLKLKDDIFALISVGEFEFCDCVYTIFRLSDRELLVSNYGNLSEIIIGLKKYIEVG